MCGGVAPVGHFIACEPGQGPARDHAQVDTHTHTHTQYVQWLINTGAVGLAVVAITLMLAIPAGCALARMTGPWGKTLGIAIFITYLVLPTILFISFSRIIAALGLQVEVGAYPSAAAAE